MLIWLKNQRKVRYRTFQLRFSSPPFLDGERGSPKSSSSLRPVVPESMKDAESLKQLEAQSPTGIYDTSPNVSSTAGDLPTDSPNADFLFGRNKPVNLPASNSAASITSEYFGDAEVDFAIQEVVRDETDSPSRRYTDETDTPKPPSMRRNGTSWGSFGSRTQVSHV